MSDVIIIGAGVVGCAIAEALAGSGVSVRVLDARAPGRGATQASAGVLSPYIEGHDSEALCRLGQRSLELFDAFVARLSPGTPLFYERNGTLEVAMDAAGAERLQRSCESITRAGIDARWIAGAELAAFEPALGPGARGALLVPEHGYVAVSGLTQALSASAARNGARFESGVRVTGVAPHPSGGVIVSTAAGTIEADIAVLAAGSWSAEIAIAGQPHVPVKPIRGQLLHLSLPARLSTRVLWGPDCYLVPWPDGSVLVGATVEDVGFDERATVAGVDALLDAACALAPGLSNAAFSGVRVGLRPAGRDDLPMVGASKAVPGLIYATGHYRNGVLLSPLTAELVRQLVAGESSDPALVDLSPERAGLL